MDGLCGSSVPFALVRPTPHTECIPILDDDFISNRSRPNDRGADDEDDINKDLFLETTFAINFNKKMRGCASTRWRLKRPLDLSRDLFA